MRWFSKEAILLSEKNLKLEKLRKVNKEKIETLIQENILLRQMQLKQRKKNQFVEKALLQA